MKRLFLLAAFCAATTAHATTYNLQVLQSLSGSGDSTAYALNDNGTVVGSSYNANTGQNESVYWENGTATSLGVTGLARGINNSGTIVGETGNATLFTPNGEAYSYTTSGGVTMLGTLGGAYSGAYDINESGVITGHSYTSTENLLQTQGFVYESGVMTSLGTVSSPTGYSRGHGINDAGAIVGRTSAVNFTDSDKHMTYWADDGTLVFHGDKVTGNYSTGQQINNNGIIVGNGRQAETGNTQFGMVWAEDGTLLSVLGNFGGGTSRAWSLNDDGVIVGYADNAAGDRLAMVSYDGVNVVNLNTVVDLTGTGFVSLNEAYDINASGQIVGIGTLADGSQGAFMLTAVPIPAAVWLFGGALGLLVVRARQKDEQVEG